MTTCTDGENGGWFRNVTEGANFWSAFYLPLLERVRAGTAGISPTFISDYLKVHGAQGEVRVRTGAWNTGWHHGRGFTQWTGSAGPEGQASRPTPRSARPSMTRAGTPGEQGSRPDDGELAGRSRTALWRLLRAETSCNIYWGEAWVPRAEADLEVAREALARIGIEAAPPSEPGSRAVSPDGAGCRTGAESAEPASAGRGSPGRPTGGDPGAEPASPVRPEQADAPASHDRPMR